MQDLNKLGDKIRPLMRQLESSQLAQYDGHLSSDFELGLSEILQEMGFKSLALVFFYRVGRRFAPELINGILEASARHETEIRVKRVVCDDCLFRLKIEISEVFPRL